MAKKSAVQVFVNGLWAEVPIFRLVLGMCPTLAVTNAVINGVAMGLAVAFVLLFSSIFVSAIKKIVPNQVRIATYIVIIAAFVTMADRFMAAYFPPLSKALGPFVPLIVVNCIILGRQEAFASKNSVGLSIVDALGMSLGFMLVLLLLGSIREILGSGTWLGMRILGTWFEPWVIMLLPAGAFITLGLLVGIANQIDRRVKRR